MKIRNQFLGLLICYSVALLFLLGSNTGCGPSGPTPPANLSGIGSGNGSTGNPTSSGSGNIKGLITKTDDGLPQDSATIATSTNSTTSEIDGSYEIIGEKAEIRTVSAAKTNYQTSKKNVLVEDNKDTTCNIKMPPNASGFVFPPIIQALDTNSGAANTDVKLTGTDFGSTEGVANFNDIQAEVVAGSWNNTIVTVKVPIGLSGDVKISLIRYNDGQKSNDIDFTITP